MSNAPDDLERYASSEFEVEIDCDENRISYHHKGFYRGEVAPKAFDALRRVLDLHNECVAHPGKPYEARFCEHDDQRYPCVTVQFLREELREDS
jgi:hypothetical protein